MRCLLGLSLRATGPEKAPCRVGARDPQETHEEERQTQHKKASFPSDRDRHDHDRDRDRNRDRDRDHDG
eukprot:10492122-Alexandrium_andersonii.AAC.1